MLIKMRHRGPDSHGAYLDGKLIRGEKIEELKVGDLIHDGKMSGEFEMPAVPAPMFSLAIEPAARGDEVKLGTCLDKLSDEDPCFKATHNAHLSPPLTMQPGNPSDEM